MQNGVIIYRLGIVINMVLVFSLKRKLYCHFPSKHTRNFFYSEHIFDIKSRDEY